MRSVTEASLNNLLIAVNDPLCSFPLSRRRIPHLADFGSLHFHASAMPELSDYT
jgi:hypothetical protein